MLISFLLINNGCFPPTTQVHATKMWKQGTNGKNTFLILKLKGYVTAN